MTTHLTTATIADADEARAHLLAADVPGPTLHPRVNGDDSWGRNGRWNGWNRAVAVGVDPIGQPVTMQRLAYASGHADYLAGHAAAVQRLGDDALDRLAYPLEMLPAVAVIEHPEHTPGYAA